MHINATDFRFFHAPTNTNHEAPPYALFSILPVTYEYSTEHLNDSTDLPNCTVSHEARPLHDSICSMLCCWDDRPQRDTVYNFVHVYISVKGFGMPDGTYHSYREKGWPFTGLYRPWQGCSDICGSMGPHRSREWGENLVKFQIFCQKYFLSKFLTSFCSRLGVDSMRAHTHTHIHMHTRAHTHKHAHTRTRANTHTCVIYIYIYTFFALSPE